MSRDPSKPEGSRPRPHPAGWGAAAGAAAGLGEAIVLGVLNSTRQPGELAFLGAIVALAAILGAALALALAPVLRRRPRLARAVGLAAVPTFYLVACWYGIWNTGLPYTTPAGIAGAILWAGMALGLGWTLAGCARTAAWIGLLLWPALFAYVSLEPYLAQPPGPALAAIAPAAGSEAARPPPVLVLALDGLDPALARELAPHGMPHLQAIFEKGSSAALESLPRSASPALWTSAFTGVLAERHGVFDFIVLEGPGGLVWHRATYPAVPLLPFWNRIAMPLVLSTELLAGRITGTDDRRVASVWELVGQAGAPCAVVGLLATHPATGPCAVLSDRYFQGAAGSVFPPGYQEWIGPGVRFASLVDEWVAIARLESERARAAIQDPHPAAVVLRRALERDGAVAGAAARLLPRLRPELAIVYLRLADDLSHAAWRYFRPAPGSWISPAERRRFAHLVPATYRWLDRQIGRLRAAMGDGAITIVVSDHGFGRHHLGLSHYQAPAGLVAMAGPGVRRGVVLRDPRLLDLAPTLLLLGRVPRYGDQLGRPWIEALEAPLLAAAGARIKRALPRRAARAASRAAAGEQELLERLRALGYL